MMQLSMLVRMVQTLFNSDGIKGLTLRGLSKERRDY
jgi:hypothetical protein